MLPIGKSKALPRLSDEEFAALEEVGTRPVRMITDKQRDLLIALGYISEIVPANGLSTLTLTGSGLRRLERGK